METILSVLYGRVDPSRRTSSLPARWERTVIPLSSPNPLTSWVYTKYIPVRKAAASALPHSWTKKQRGSGEHVLAQGFPTLSQAPWSATNTHCFTQEKVQLFFCGADIIKNLSGMKTLHETFRTRGWQVTSWGGFWKTGGTKLSAVHVIICFQ